MDSNKAEPQASGCFMCKQAGRDGCLECRTHRLLSDIKTALYERLGAEQNQSEWEERALAAERELSESKGREKAMREALESFVRGFEVGEMVGWGGNGYEHEPLRLAKAALTPAPPEAKPCCEPCPNGKCSPSAPCVCEPCPCCSDSKKYCGRPCPKCQKPAPDAEGKP